MNKFIVALVAVLILVSGGLIVYASTHETIPAGYVGYVYDRNASAGDDVIEGTSVINKERTGRISINPITQDVLTYPTTIVSKNWTGLAEGDNRVDMSMQIASQEGKNALLAACSAALNLHAIAPHEKGLGRINVGEIEGGLCTNTICPECTIRLEYRGQTAEIAEYFGKRVFDVLDGTARTYDIPYSYIDFDEVPTAQSDESLMRVIEAKAEELPWFEKIYFDGNLGGTDDAAAMMAKVQEHGGVATYIGIGCDITEPLHNPRFDFDEDCMAPTVELLAKIMRG